MIYLIVYFICWIIAFILYSFVGGASFLFWSLYSHLVIGVGFFGIFNFIGHTILSEKVARTIGWVSNGFQKELGFVSLGIGICGILCHWVRDCFWIATAIPFCVFLIGAGILHIIEIKQKNNFNKGNVWIILPDFLMPITLIILFISLKI
ncbi:MULTISPECIES: DUF6790 family protein [unclassified Capnocytophaga]|uniref:DUF6790 family protein n=1 Tax=unclassified Capnocytophaga TaxID=2640652 RepID=UPI000202E8FA|nr:MULTISPECIES: DUF6790 family protein [unclassified Capnocytophaga]EGD34182.1 hypothetical protein HMPREF9071_1117 [Capnocytophaga sp. oral taxon 338 str. F0234]MEB3004864.1 DUF6790 family protein [Capnocytophaga sp. G2]